MSNATTQQEIDATLDDVTLNQMVWKSNKLLHACLLIAGRALTQPVFWPDELTPQFILGTDDRRLIGSAWRVCITKLKIIQKTGQWSRSQVKECNGNHVFQYSLINRAMATAFLQRHDATKLASLLSGPSQIALL